MFLEIRKSKSVYYGVLRSSYRKDGKVYHRNHGTLWDMPLETLQMLKLTLAGDAIPKNKESNTVSSKEYGASYTFLSIARQTGLDKMIYSRTTEQWVHDVLAMVTGRLVYAGSKLYLSNTYKDSALWELCGIKTEVDVEKHCYLPMDRLLERQKSIQRQLVSKHLTKGILIMYDITSSYMEGEYAHSNIVYRGYNRDQKKGHEQIVIGLLCNEEGCPVAIEVFPGNTTDASTVMEKLNEIKQEYGVEDILFVGDRGMITPMNYEKISTQKSAYVVTALTHRQMTDLLNRKVIQLGLFDNKDVVEIIDPESPQKRYCLCRNESVGEKETKIRREILKVIETKLNKICAIKKKRKAEQIGKQVGKALAKTNMEHFIQWQVSDGRLVWNFLEDKIAEAQLLDGCYIIFTDAPVNRVEKKHAVKTYKNLQLVEQAFRQLKTVLLEIRPVYHKHDDRIRSHVFICMLSYYILWHFKNKLKDLLNNEKNTGKKRFWTIDRLIERLKSIRKEKRVINGIDIYEITIPDDEQQKILDILGIKM
jgi:transposase